MNLNNVKTSLPGMVVTPTMQQTKHVGDKYPLKFLLTDQMRTKFAKNTFPIVEVNSKGELFMKPTQHIITPMSNTYMKWFCIDKEYNPSHDHNYPMTKVKPTGYFMRVSINGNSTGFSNNCDFVIDYIQDIESIETTIIKNRDSGDMENNLVIDPYSVESQGDLAKRIIKDEKEFFELYLKDIYN